MKKLKLSLTVLSAFASLAVSAQQIDYLVTEFNQSIYQDGANSSFGMGDLQGWNSGPY